ncbi:Condensin complex subunit 3 [Cyberlindnera fabianii]|uniref:Condensin complex subunit 3 n=1 Tax=Cyberlindnera fabianii TaxID=36022 RepID=A0A1V2L0U8_CYBFA|nr:Condensin complex subunit 3 [Cyberlindnera fabianii]
MAAVVKEAHRMTERLTEPEQIQKALAQVFQNSQQSVAGHRKQVLILKAIQARAETLGHEESFNYYFCQVVNKVLVVKRTESAGDRIAKLVASFVQSLQADFPGKEEEEEQDDEEDEEEEDNIFTRFVKYFVDHLLRGIEAKDKNVRYRVIQFLDLTMGSLGEISDTQYEKLMFQLDKRLHDKEPSIRIKALRCISRFQGSPEEQTDEVDEATAKLLIAIQNDPSPEVRRAALLNLVKTGVTKNYLLERAKDTNTVNRRLVYSRVIKEMGDFRTIDSKTREKILSWGLKDRESSVQKACVKMLSDDWLYSTLNGDMIELLERLYITRSEVAELAMKKLFDYRKDLNAKIKFPAEIWNSLTPEIAFLSRTFYEHCNENTLNEVVDENYPESAQLANLLSKYLATRKEQTESDDVADYEFIAEQLLKIAVNYDFSDEIGRRAMLQVVRSSLTNDRLPENLISVSLEVLHKLSINERDFCAMVTEIITDIGDSAEDLEEAQKREVTIHCLCICKSMLKLTNEPLKGNLSVDSLIDTLINPAVRGQDPTLRELGTEALGLYGLLDLQLATDQLYLFGLCLSRGHQELRMVALKAIFDILSVHGTKVLDVEDGVDSLSLHKLLYRTLRNDELPELQALCAEGLCKLYLADILTDDELFETLILTYYNPANAKNQSLLQAFSFCLPVYCFSHRQHQERMAKVAGDAFTRLYQAHSEDSETADTMISPAAILQQLIHWTDPANVVNADAEEIAKSQTHLTLITDLFASFNTENNKKYEKLIVSSSAKINLGDNLPVKPLEKLLSVLDDADEDVELLDGAAKRQFVKFYNKTAELVTAAREKAAEDPTTREFSVILEEEDEDDSAKSSEVDEDFEKEQSQIIDAKESDEDAHIGGDILADIGEQAELSDEEHTGDATGDFEDAPSHSPTLDEDGDLSME